MEGNRFGNYVADQNRFQLAQPPDWWLSALYDFDPMLVIVPSRKDRKYLLCRRRQFSAGLGDVAMLDNKHPDTNMCYALHVVPIAPLVFRTNTPAWTQGTLNSLIAELKGRDTWALTGGPRGLHPDAAWQAVEAMEAAQEARDHQGLRDKFHHMARDAWRSLKARTGQRNKRASEFHGHAPTPTGGRIITP